MRNEARKPAEHYCFWGKRLYIFCVYIACFGRRHCMIGAKTLHLLPQNIPFPSSICPFSLHFQPMRAYFSSISNVKISLFHSLQARKLCSASFFSVASSDSSKQAILRPLGKQNVTLSKTAGNKFIFCTINLPKFLSSFQNFRIFVPRKTDCIWKRLPTTTSPTNIRQASP